MSILICNGTALAAVMVHVDRFNISEDETVNLTIEVTGDDSGDPQTAPLQKNFEILSNNHSSSFSFTNGSSSSKSVYQLILRPRHAGALTIPALKVGSASTSPIMIQVNKAQARTSPSGQPVGDVWLSMEVTPKQVRVQQQVIITIRVYMAVGLNQAQLTEPVAENAVIERLGADSSYQKRENNRTWQVTERHYALFPQQSGHIEINPVQLDGSVLSGGASYFQTTRPVRVRSNSLSLDVSAMPGGWNGDHWLPAKQVEIEESWPSSNTEFKVGEPITRTLTLRADGLSSSQLPEFSQELPDHLKSYADKPVLNDNKLMDGVHGMREEKVAIMPMQPGTYILPEIDIAWWNTETEKVEHAMLPVRTFTVVAAPASESSTPSESHPQTPGEVNQPMTPAAPQQQVVRSSWWQWLALLSSAGWLLTLVYVWRLRRRGERRRGRSEKTAIHVKQAVTSIETACQNNDSKACEKALLSVACLQSDQLQSAGSSFNSLSTLMPICSEALQAEILKLEKALYAPGASPWQGDLFLQVFRQEGGFTTPQSDIAEKTDALPGLYPE